MTRVEERLREWAEFDGVTEASMTGQTNLLHRLITEGPTAASAGRSHGDPTPTLASRYGASMALAGRVSEVSLIVQKMPEDYRQVLRLEWLEGKGYRRARAELEWSEGRWVRTRAAMLGWLAGRLGCEAPRG